MSILMTDSSLGVMHSSALGMPPKVLTKECPTPYMPCGNQRHWVYACKTTLDCYVADRKTKQRCTCMPAMPALTEMRISPCGRYLYQLSGEVDYVHTRHLGTGDLLFSAPCGVFPKSMQFDETGKHLLIAGGLMNEVLLLSAPELLCQKRWYTPHACFFADFWQGGMLLLCAKEGEDIQTIVYTMKPDAIRPRKLLTLTGPPCALCVCPDGYTALLSTPDGLMKINIQNGTLLWNLPKWAHCAKIQCKDDLALVSDTLTGEICLLDHDQPWHSHLLISGNDAQACFL